MALSTTYDLIQEAARQPSHGASSTCDIVALPSEGFGPYLVKIGNHRELTRSTSLTPVSWGLEHNFGQPLLLDSATANCHVPLPPTQQFEILAKVPGTSLEAIKREMRDERGGGYEAAMEAHTIMLERVARLPDFSFERWMAGRRHLIDKGIGGDNNLGNILYEDEGKSLRDIDVVRSGNTRWTGNNVGEIVASLTPKDRANLSRHLRGRQDAALEVIKEQLERSATLHGVPLQPSGFNGKLPPIFRKVDLTGKLGHFRLSRAPEELRAFLQEMVSSCHIPLG